MEADKIIISMTSWPKRIHNVAKAIYSLIQQDVDNSKYHIVLVLCDKEFPNKEKDLPSNLLAMYENGIFEIIWTPTNTFSHKKLMPTLAKYPNNPILVCDEDILRPKDWLSYFVKDHIEHPNDILVGGCVFDICFEKNGKFNPVKRFAFDKPSSAGKIIKNRRPANGFGGVLYPAGTFTDPRFFDEELYMKLSRYSDESWQYCFNIMEDRTIRWISKIIPHQNGQQAGTYETSMSKIRSNSKNKNDSYVEIYKRLFDEFPLFKQKLIERLK